MSHSGNKRSMHLGVFLDVSGHYASAWRHPSAQPQRFHDLAYYKELAGAAEKAKLDMVFLSDRYGIPDSYGNRFDTTVRSISCVRLDPVSLITALAGVTEKIGLAATSSTSFTEPFLTARQFASIDHLSGGRVGWNVVTSTSDNEARNFSRPSMMDHQARYDRAREFMEAANGLWDSWEAGAYRIDKEAGVFADASKIHYTNYSGRYVQVRGPLDVPRSPQGRPVIIQAGASDAGRDFAAQFTDVVFTAQPNLQSSQSFYADMKKRAAAKGRQPDYLKIMPGVMPIVAETEAEAKAIEASLSELVDPLAGLALLSDQINYDLSVHSLDEPLPELKEVSGMQSRLQLVAKMLQTERLTLRELGQFYAGSRMHTKAVGSPEQVADFMESWFTNYGCDGFNLMFPYMPDSMMKFIDLVVPELQRRGLFRTEYAGSTLRDHLGLPPL
jgi:FMN-dependent oxidoreductase (nitrilotriacetate monooxygenase family)